MYSILAWQISILDSMNDKIRSRELYLPTIAVVVGDADSGDDRTRPMSKSLMLKSSSKSSMRGGGRARRSWRRIRWDVAPSDLDRRRLVVKVGSSRADSASQKPYSPSPGAGSQRQGFRRPTLPNTGARRWSGWRDYGSSAVARRRKFYLTTLGFFNWNFQ
jgi:hypothetical protein